MRPRGRSEIIVSVDVLCFAFTLRPGRLTFREHHIYTLSTISTHTIYTTLSAQAVLEGLSARGHKLARQDSFSSVVVGVQRAEDGRIYANTDFRKAGAVDGF